METNILVIDDSPVCALFATQAVNKMGHVQASNTVKDALQNLQTKKWDLVLIDIHLGQESGFHVYEDMQKNPQLRNIPVIFVSGDSDISQKSLAFSLGADDYIVKPYNFLELQMRAQRLLKKNPRHQEFLSFGPFKLSNNQMFLYFQNLENVEIKVELSPKEYQLMKFLIENPHQIFSRQQLLDKVWGQDVYITDRTIDTHVYSLRKKLGPYAKMLVSVRSWGYQLAEVDPIKIKGVA